MTLFSTKMSETIINDSRYHDAANALFSSYVKKTIGEEWKIERNTIKNLTTAMQYLYQSDVDSHKREGAELISMLLHLSGDETPELIPIAEHVFNQSGDFPNIELLKKMFSDRAFRLSVFDDARKQFRRELNTVDEISHLLTDYQRNLWEHLRSDEDVITSAPTSTGKTHVILKYLLDRMANRTSVFAGIIVPTRALISEISNKVHEIAKEIVTEEVIEVCTYPKDGPFNDKTIFVMTQERLFEILQSNIIRFNYLFIDEAHNISDKSRGVLLHMTLEKLLEDSNPQVIISTPSPKYINAFSSIFRDIDFTTRSTNHSPVAKLFIETTCKGGNIVLTKLKTKHSTIIKKEFTGKKLANIVYRLGKGESNIIYRNRTNFCENTAKDIANLIPDEIEDPRLSEAADYVAKFIHRDFTLADNLKKGVAFHYGPLPGVVRRMVESLARDNVVNYIVCTSTLAEGVNLPAKNLFLQNPMHMPPYKPTEKLDDVVFDNITGRAGRMLEHFAGNIFLVEPENWEFTEYLEPRDQEPNEIPTFYKVLNTDFDQVIKILTGNNDPSEDDLYTYYSIANKLLREFESDKIDETLSAKELTIPKKSKQTLIKAVQHAHENLKVSPFTLEANPTVGYLQQNNLYNFLSKQKDLSDWALPHPMSSALWDQLLKVCTELNNFGIFLPKKSSIDFACIIAKKWVQGKPLRSMIAEQRQRYPDDSCNKSVRNVIATINEDVRFKMASALRCYQLLLSDIAEQRRLALTNVKLHVFIEIGGCSNRLIQLVNLGLSREVAVEIHELLGDGIEISSFKELRSLYKRGLLNEMHPVSKREVEKLL